MELENTPERNQRHESLDGNQLRQELFDQLEHLLRFYIINTVVMYFENGHHLLSNALKANERDGNRRIDNIFTQIDKVKGIWESCLTKNESVERKSFLQKFIEDSDLFKQKLISISEIENDITAEQMEELREITISLFNCIKKEEEYLLSKI
jgi:hypothetical protein